jgi:hypothetical protein
MWLLPVSFFAAAGMLELPPLTRAAAALLAPLISTVGGGLFGLEYRSYLWVGFGMFPQSVAAHLLLLSLGFGWQALRRGRHLTLTGALLGLTCLAHFIYGYIGAVTLCLLALLPDREVARRPRILRTLRIGAVAFVLSAFQLLPLVQDAGFLNHSRFEPPAKWDSYGAGYILSWLFTGRLFDFLRIPVLTLLIFGGVGLLIRRYRRQRRLSPIQTFTLAGAAFWLLVYFGRSTWGPLLYLVGVTPDLHLHRVIAGFQIFAVLLAAMALHALWRSLGSRSIVLAAVVTLALLTPMVYERAVLFRDNVLGGQPNLTAIQAEQPAIDAVIASAKQHGGRAYAGMVSTWGKQFTAGVLPFFTFFSTRHVPAVSFMYSNLTLPSDIMMRFDETNPEHFRLFNVRTVVLPAGPAAPDFIKLRTQAGRFRVFDAPGAGYFDVVDVAAAVPTTRDSFFDINEHWMYSQWVPRRQHLWLELLGPAPAGMPRVPPGVPLPAPPQHGQDAGIVRAEKENAGVFEADLSANRAAYAFFRMTWHPNWKAYLDGKPAATAMLSPGFIGIPMEPGAHHLMLRYEGAWWRLWMAAAGALLVVLAGVWERRGLTPAPPVSANP